MRYVMSLFLMGLLASSASAQNCSRQRQVIRLVQQPQYEVRLSQQACDSLALRLESDYAASQVLAVTSAPAYAVVVEERRQPLRLRLKQSLSRGSRLRLSSGHTLRVERRGLLGLRQRIYID